MNWVDILIAVMQCAVSVCGALIALFTYVRNGRMKVSQSVTADEISEIRKAVVPAVAKPKRYYVPVFDEDGKVVARKEVKADEVEGKEVEG